MALWFDCDLDRLCAEHVLRFIAHAHQEDQKSHSAIASSCTASISYFKTVGRADEASRFADPRVLDALRGLHRKDLNRKRPERIPITMWMLAKYLPKVKTDKDLVTFGACLIGLCGLLRASEFVSKAPYGCTLRRSHITFGQGRVDILLVRSKTDTFEEGVTITVFATSGHSLCPVSWLRDIYDNHSKDKSPDAPAFQKPDGTAVTYYQLQTFLKKIAAEAGVSASRVSAHSLRIGGATTLFELGYLPDVVKRLGRWVSDCYQRYQRLGDSVLRSIAKAFVTTASDESHGMVGSQTVLQACRVNAITLDECHARLTAGKPQKKSKKK